MPKPIASPQNPLATIATCWLVHGILITLCGLLLPLMSDIIQQGDWAESMRLMGADELIDPARALTTALAPTAVWLIALGIPCIGVGITARCWPLRAVWGLHILAIIHLLLVPWSSWALHRRLGDLTGAGIGTLLGEILTVLATEATLVIAIVVVERARRASK